MNIPKITYISKNGEIKNNNSNSKDFDLNYLSNEPNLKLFMKDILPILIRKAYENRKNVNNKNPIKIVIVTHSLFMEKNLIKDVYKNDIEKKKELINYRGEDIKVYNCDVYKINLQNKEIEMFFPKKDNYEKYDYYGMPPTISDKKFYIQNKNVTPIYINKYKKCLKEYDVKNEKNKKECNEIFEIMFGLCEIKNNKIKLFIKKKLKELKNKNIKNNKNNNKTNIKELKNKNIKKNNKINIKVKNE